MAVFSALDFLAEITQHIPDKGPKTGATAKHGVVACENGELECVRSVASSPGWA
jgi:hypothetical protein